MKKTNEKGITLIALVITIIVLLILAGISIAMLTGNNGILEQANNAKERTKIATYEEELRLIGLGLETKQVDDSEFLDRYVEEIKADEMFKEAKKIEKVSDTKIEVITKEGYVFEVTRDNVEYKGKDDGSIPEEPDEPEIEVPELQEGDINFSYNPDTYTQGSVEVTIEAKIELENSWIEYSTSGTSWTKYENPITVDKNGEIYARISNSAGPSVYVATGNVENIDRLAPNEPSLSVTETTENSITVQASATDQAATAEYASSGIKGYQFSINNGAWEPVTPQANGTYTFSNLIANTSYSIKVKAIDNVDNEKEITNAATVTTEKHIEPIGTTTSYVANYADTNGDGKADGIIFADLAVGGNGTVFGESYSIPTARRLKEYYIANENYSDSRFGNKSGKLIAPVEGASGNDRFYIMALEDMSSTTYYWYYNSITGNSLISTDFGSGKENTEHIMNEWTSSSWGAQNSRDMWGIVQEEVNKKKTNNDKGTWFVPSIKEWVAFAGNLGITNSNYINYGLRDWYWSSSQYTHTAYYVYFRAGYIRDNEPSKFRLRAPMCDFLIL